MLGDWITKHEYTLTLLKTKSWKTYWELVLPGGILLAACDIAKNRRKWRGEVPLWCLKTHPALFLVHGIFRESLEFNGAWRWEPQYHSARDQKQSTRVFLTMPWWSWTLEVHSSHSGRVEVCRLLYTLMKWPNKCYQRYECCRLAIYDHSWRS